MLFKKTLREIKAHFGQFFAIFAMVALASMIYIIVTAYSGGMKHNCDDFYKENNLPDLWAYGEIDEDILKNIQNTPGVAGAERILTVRGSARIDGEEEEIPIDITFTDPDVDTLTINTFHVTDGSNYDANADGLWLSRMFAENHNIKVGDDFTVTYEGYDITKTVLGIISVPDSVYKTADDNTIFQDASKYGWIYLSMNSFPEEYIYDEAIKSDEVQDFLEGAADLEDSVSQLTEMGMTEAEAWKQVKEAAEIDDKINLQKAVELSSKIKDKSAALTDKADFIKALDSDFSLQDAYVFSTCIIDVDGLAPGILEKGDEGFSAKLSDTKKAVSQIDGVDAVTDRESCYSFVAYKSECEEGDTYSVMFTGIFVFIAILAVITTMNRFVKQQRIQIGTLKALGFRKKRVIRHYLSYGFYVSVIGVIVGDLIGYYGLAGLLVEMEAETYDVPGLTKYFDATNFIAAAVIILCIVTVAYLSCSKILNESAAQTLRLEVPRIKMKSKEGGRGLTSKMKFATKWNLRDIKRSKARTAMGVVGIMGATLIIVLAFGMMDSFDRYIQWNFDDISHYKYSMSLSKNITDKELDALYDSYGDATAETVVITYKNADGELVDATVTVNDSHGMLRVSDKNIQTHDIEDGIPGSTVGNVDDDGAIIVTGKLLKKMGMSLGDTVEWQPAGSDEWYSSKIVAQGRHPQMQQFSMTRKAYEGLGRTYEPDTIFTDADLSDASASDIDGVESIASLASLKQQLQDMLGTFKVMIWMFIILAGLLGLVIIYNMGILSMSEKNYQFATLKVLGFRVQRIRRIYEIQNIWIAIVGIILGLPAGFYFTDYIFKYSIGDNYDFFATVDISTYLIAIGFMFGVTLLTNWILGRKIKTIDMVTALKANE